MNANVIELPHQSGLRTPIGHVIRTGETSWRQLEHLHAEGRLPAGAFIVDASKARYQQEFIRSLREEGSDIILDTKAAELSEVGKFRGAARGALWSLDRPLGRSDFEAGSNTDVFGKIARHAIELGVTTVMAPTHFLRNGAADPWLPIDIASVSLLRVALNREGGDAIAIDYPLILPHARLLEGSHRVALINALREVAVDNLLVRLSGFGSDAGPLTTKRTLVALEDLHSLRYPVVLDHLGGLVGLSSVAFGIVSGLAHGIGEHDRFDARAWHKPPKERDPEAPFGRASYVPLPGFDKAFRPADLEKIASANGGRRLVACPDRACCEHGLRSMLENPKAHIARQKRRSIEELDRVPDVRRVGHFLDHEVRNAERKAGDLVRLKTGDERLDKTLAVARKRIDSMARMYETLSERERLPSRPMAQRGSSKKANGHGAL